MSATTAMLEDEFKKFGPIKNGGIQVRSNRVCVLALIFWLFGRYIYQFILVSAYFYNKLLLVDDSNRDFVLALWNYIFSTKGESLKKKNY